MWLTMQLAHVVGVLTLSGPCDSARTTVQIEQCLKRVLTAEEQQLGGVERDVAERLRGDNKAQFDSAGATWRSYRERECRAVYNANADGTIAASSFLGCEIELTRSRRLLLVRIHSADR